MQLLVLWQIFRKNQLPSALDFAIRNNIVPSRLQARKGELDRQWQVLKGKYRDKEKTDRERLPDPSNIKAVDIKYTIGELGTRLKKIKKRGLRVKT